jgi:hypothetical protein
LFIYDTFVQKIFIFTHNKFFRFWLNSQIWLFCELCEKQSILGVF